MNNLKLIYSGHIDRKIIEAALAVPGPYYIDVVNNYATESAQNLLLNAADLDSTDLEALLRVIDNATFPMEEDAYIYKVLYTSHNFDMEYSYVRDAISTDGLLTAIPDGSAIMITFEIPGFEISQSRTITAWYNQAFDPDEMDALAEIGISLVGDGTKFLMVNEIECKVSFNKPELVTEAYVIDYNNVNQVILPS